MAFLLASPSKRMRSFAHLKLIQVTHLRISKGSRAPILLPTSKRGSAPLQPRQGSKLPWTLEFFWTSIPCFAARSKSAQSARSAERAAVCSVSEARNKPRKETKGVRGNWFPLKVLLLCDPSYLWVIGWELGSPWKSSCA